MFKRLLDFLIGVDRTPPHIGAEYIRRDVNPYENWRAVVKEVRDGYVLYSVTCDGKAIYNSDSTKIKVFNMVWRENV